MRLDRRFISNFDFPLLLVTLLIPVAGLVVLYSAGYDPESAVALFGILPKTVKSAVFARQLTFIGFGFASLLLFSFIDARFFFKYAYVFYVICVLLLIAVLFVGVVSNGARRWISLGGVQFQPSEFAKIAIIFALARYMSLRIPSRDGLGFTELIGPSVLFAIPMGLIIKQPDLGTALCVGILSVGMLFFVGIRSRTMIWLIAFAAVAAVPIWDLLHDYQKKRIFTLIDPTTDPLGSGYHIIQSKIAVGSGQFIGKGYLKGTQSQLMFLPEHTTDFIFSVLAEEWGFVGCATVLALYSVLLLLILGIVRRSKDIFSSLVCVGVGALFFTHIVVNMGMVIGVLPVVGITLPLFSYGGSSVITFMSAIGVVLGISMRRWVFIGR